MNKEDAIQAMKNGKKVRHNYFGADEWMKQPNKVFYEFEDGITCPVDEFWQYREGLGFETGWSIV